MEGIVTWLQSTLGLSTATLGRIVASVAVAVIVWAARRVTLALVWRRVDDVRARYRWQKSTAYLAMPLVLLIIGRIWWEGVSSLATFLGLLSAGVAIALKDPLTNFAGWAFILWRRPFEVGDRIEVESNAGDVIDLRIFQFTLLEIGNWVGADQSTGRIIHIPNGTVFTKTIANYSKGFQYIWNELPVMVTFESDWRKAKQLLLDIGNKHAEHLSDSAQQKIREVSRRFMIFYATLTPTVYTSVAESGVLLTIRYLSEPRKRRSTEQAIWEDVLSAFGERDDIDFAYPTRRFYDNRTEGKPEARAD